MLLLLLHRTVTSFCHLLLVSSDPLLILILSSCAGLYFTSSSFLYSICSFNLVAHLFSTLLILIIWSRDSPHLFFQDIDHLIHWPSTTCFLYQSLTLHTVQLQLCNQAMHGSLCRTQDTYVIKQWKDLCVEPKICNKAIQGSVCRTLDMLSSNERIRV